MVWKNVELEGIIQKSINPKLGGHLDDEFCFAIPLILFYLQHVKIMILSRPN
jgi:hypothetical protein